jgi:uncharacterized protein DUF6906
VSICYFLFIYDAKHRFSHYILCSVLEYSTKFSYGGENVKHGRRLSRKHKVFLEKEGYDANEYLIERNTSEKAVFISKKSNKKLVFEK